MSLHFEILNLCLNGEVITREVKVVDIYSSALFLALACGSGVAHALIHIDYTLAKDIVTAWAVSS